MLASNVHVGMQALVHHAQPLLDAASEFEVLQKAYIEYAEALRDPVSDASKARLGHLMDQMQARGVYGNNALALLQKYSFQINWQGMSPEVFNSFYRFVYFICREPNRRNVQVPTAVAAWRLLLCGRFRLLDRFCSFVTTHLKSTVILEDTWRQVLDFSRTVHEDLSNYDPASAWPVLLDEFVEHIKGARHANRPSVYVNVNLQPLDMLSPWSVKSMAAVSPRSGSKRRPPDVGEVADQLQQLPLETADSSQGAATSPRVVLTAKRLRVGLGSDISTSRARQESASDAAVAMNGYRQQEVATDSAMHIKRVAGAAGGASAAAFGQMEVPQGQQQQQYEFTPGCMAPPASHHGGQHHHHQQRLRAGGQPGMGAPGQQQFVTQQQQQSSGNSGSLPSSNSTGSGSMDVPMDSADRPRQQQQIFFAGLQPGVVQSAAQLPPCPSPVHGGRVDYGAARRTMERAHSVNAMMQVTVTEALGFN